MEYESLRLLGYLLALLQVVGLLAALHAIFTVRTAQGALAWAIALVFMPSLTLLPYLVFGRSNFSSYVSSRRHADLAMRQSPGFRPWLSDQQHVRSARENPAAHFSGLTALSDMPLLANNRLRLLINGQATFEAILQSIAQAREVVLVQFFIIRDDELGRRLRQALLERAQAGVRVFLLFDSVGSHALPAAWLQKLRAAGVQVQAFAARRGLRNRYQLNFRNHRKIVVIDGCQGYVGGHNVGDEYLGGNPALSPWRDTHLQICGPVVSCLQQSFAEDWFWAAGKLPELHSGGDWPQHGALCQLVTSGPADSREACSLFFVAAIHAAQQRIWLTSPYFVPDEAVFAALRLAVLRGVDVRILLPSRPDHRMVFAASSLYAAEAVRAGVRIFRYQPGFMHQKVVLIDDGCAAVGSANLDNRSFRLNFELMLLCLDSGFAREVEQMLLADFEQAREQTVEATRRLHRLQHLGMRLARLFSPVM
jgi:cardiolipin synthase